MFCLIFYEQLLVNQIKHFGLEHMEQKRMHAGMFKSEWYFALSALSQGWRTNVNVI